MLNFYILDIIKNNKFVITYFKRKIHFVDNLFTKIFINVNTIILKKIVINIDKQKIIINSCEIIIKFNIKFKNQRIDRIVRILQQLTISLYTHITIFVKIKNKQLLNDKNYFFLLTNESRLKIAKSFFAYIINVHLIVVQIRNLINKSIIIFKNKKVKQLQNFKKKNCFLALIENRHLVVKFLKQLKKAIK